MGDPQPASLMDMVQRLNVRGSGQLITASLKI